jgi:tetratricopeptide (TPR) repeat protein
MQTPSALFKFIAKSFLNLVGGGVAGDFAVEVVPQVARDVWAWWGKDRSPEETRAEIQIAAQLSAPEIRQQASELVAAEAAGRPESVRNALAAYIEQVPASIRQSQRRPADPTGRTLSSSLVLERPEDLASILPSKLPRFRPGTSPPGIGDWVLEELLGVGGFGEVWRARNPHLPEPVALKFCLDPAAARMLRNEAGLLGRVMHQGRHPGIVALRHTYLNADPPCLEYDYVAGGELTQLIADSRAKGGLSPRPAAQIVMAVAKAVGFAHRLTPPIVHRDLKPANILVQRSVDNKFSFRVADFGIGGVAATQTIEQTRAGSSLGLSLINSVRGAYTPFYASPQQLRGADPDPRDDVYALGVIWYQLLTGDLTQEAPRGRAWVRKLTEKGVPQPYLDLLGFCFEDDPADRPADARELAEKIAGLMPTDRVAEDKLKEGSTKSEKAGIGQPSIPGVAKEQPETRATKQPLPQQREAAREHFKRGKDHYDKEEAQQAISAFTEAIRLDPTLALAFMYRGDLLGDEEKPEEGIADLNEALRLDPSLALAHAYRSFIHARQGRFDQALVDCNKAVSMDPNQAEVFRIRALVYAEADNAEKALADYSEAIRLQPDFVRAYRERAAVYKAEEAYPQALQDINEAVRLAPASADLLHHRALIHFEMEEHDLALEDFNEAIAIDPRNAALFWHRGAVYSWKSQSKKAIADYTQAIVLNPDLADVYDDRGWEYYHLGEYEKAIPDFSEAISREPTAQAYNGRGWAHFDKLAYDDAITDFTEAIRLEAAYANVFLGRGSCHREKGDLAEALADYTEACRLDAEGDIVRYERGLLLIRQGQHALAAVILTEAIRLDKRFMVAYLARGVAYESLGQLDLALLDFDKAVKLKRSHAFSYHLRGRVQQAKGNSTEAQADFQKALELDPQVANATLDFLITPAATARSEPKQRKRRRKAKDEEPGLNEGEQSNPS